MKTFAQLIILTAFVASCASDKQSKNGLAYIDLRKDYPEKEILLTDIADVTYLYLNSDDDDYLYKAYEHVQRGGISDLTKNTVVVVDAASESILFFSKDGTPKSRFNRRGLGPEEYFLFFSTVRYDETADEVYISNLESNVIQVYSSTGEHKRRITLPQGINVRELIDFDDRSLFVFDNRIETQRSLARNRGEDLPTDDYVIPFYRISKTNGEVLDKVELPGTHLFLGINWNGMRIVNGSSVFSVKCPEGVMLCSSGTDTIFLYTGHKPIAPVICQTPSTASLNPLEYLDFCLDRVQYQFIKVVIVREGDKAPAAFPVKYYMRNKKTEETVRPKFILPDYKEKELIIDPYNRNSVGGFHDDGYWFELDLYELKQAYRDDKLSGKLKELVATLNEDIDNNVFVLVDFK